MARIWDCFGHWRIDPDSDESFRTADVVVTHEFGDQRTPSVSTAKIVELGVALARRFDKPLLCQYPGNKIAEGLGMEPAVVIREHLVKPGDYLDTEEVNRQVAAFALERGWKQVILCTHPHHVWRATENLKRHGLTPLRPDTRTIPYDATCPRFSLRTPFAFVPREVLARGLYLRSGLI